MAELKHLEYRYSKDYREVFEDIATLMFCTELGLDTGLNRRINQRAIESDPVCIGEKRYAYQAKYYDASTKLSDHKQDFIKCIEGVTRRNVTDLFLYINKNLPDTDPDTGEEAKYIREIEDAASGHSVELHWRTSSMIGDSLDMPKYAYIKNLYFEKNIKEYYDYVVNLYEKPNTGNTLLGEESLAELYMQPSYYKSEREICDIEQLFDEFVSNWECGVLWIVGEPGHGKTSMCIKAVADYRKMKRYLQAKGVFWFCLNPQGIPGMVNPKMLALEKVFSWGRITGNRSNMIEPGEIEGSLVFLDGYDELKSSLEEHGISSNQFHEQVNQLAKEYQMHIVVTSRTRALEQGKSYISQELKDGNAHITCRFRDGSSRKNSVKLLAPLTSEKQTKWIEDLINWRKKNNGNTDKLVEYRQAFQSIQNNKDIAGLLEIPILLRMIVQNYFEPSSDNRVELYRELFDMTLLRQSLENQQEELHSIYREIAFKIFVYNDDSAVINKEEFAEIAGSDSYLYQYYLHTPEIKKGLGKDDIYCVTFFHRSFYQYFLSEFFYEKLKSVTDVQSGKEFLKYLWARHIDTYVMNNLRLRANGEGIDCTLVLKAIDETDAFFSDYKNSSGTKELIGNYDKANNAFWNAISVCNNVFQVEASQKKMELTERIIELLSKYTCSWILLRNSFLRKADLTGADLSEANLSGANLSGADLTGANLSGADLTGVDFSEADLIKADLSEASLRGADLSRANLFKADLIGADLSKSDLINANLRGTDLSRANLFGANLFGADLIEANLRGANLGRAYLGGAYLSRPYMRRPELFGANLNRADLRRANLKGADLRRADLNRADLRRADLRRADLRGADLRDADLSGANLTGADLRGADLSGANLSGADLREANLREADLTGAILDELTPQGTKSENDTVNEMSCLPEQ